MLTTSPYGSAGSHVNQMGVGMSTSRRYAIVGSGNIGTALATLFARAAMDVNIANT